MDERQVGTVKWFDQDKGHGFITKDSGGDIFVHFSKIIATRGERDLYKGQRVSFSEIIFQGKKQAGQVEVIAS